MAARGRGRGGKSGSMAADHSALSTAEDIANNLARQTRAASKTTPKASNNDISVTNKSNPKGKTDKIDKKEVVNIGENQSENPVETGAIGGDQPGETGVVSNHANRLPPSLPPTIALPVLPKMPLIDDPAKANNETISNALNSLYELLYGNIHQTNANLGEINGKLQTLEEKLDRVQERQINFESQINQKLSDQNQRIEYQAKKIGVLDSSTVKVDEFASFKSDYYKQVEDMEDRFQAMANEILNLKIDNIRNSTESQKLEERMNVHDLRAKKHSFIVDGFPETPHENTRDALIARLNNDTGASFSAEDFISIRRMGKPDPNGKPGPRPIAVVVINDIVRSELLNCRGSLSKNADGSLVWLNEELPPAYRRRKAMLRDLVKLAIKKAILPRLRPGG